MGFFDVATGGFQTLFGGGGAQAQSLEALIPFLLPSKEERRLQQLSVESAERAASLEEQFFPGIQELTLGQLEFGREAQDISLRALRGEDVLELPGVAQALSQFETQAIQQFGPGFLQSEAGIRARAAFSDRVAQQAFSLRPQVGLPQPGGAAQIAAGPLAQAGALQGRTALAASTLGQAQFLRSPQAQFERALGTFSGIAQTAAPFFAGAAGGGVGAAAAPAAAGGFPPSGALLNLPF